MSEGIEMGTGSWDGKGGGDRVHGETGLRSESMVIDVRFAKQKR